METLKTRNKIKVNIENEEDFMKTALWKVFTIIFGSIGEAKIVYKILIVLRNDRKGFRLRGSQSKLINDMKISNPYYYKILRKMEMLGLIETIQQYSPQTFEKKVDDIVIPYEKTHKSLFIRISENTQFSNMLSNSVLNWIDFKRNNKIDTLSE